jgi:hypothetical protein
LLNHKFCGVFSIKQTNLHYRKTSTLTMKKFFTSIILIVFIFSINALGQGWRQGEMEVRVEISDSYTAETLSNLNLTGDYAPDHAILYLIPREAELLENAGIEYDVRISDLNAHYKDFWNNRAAYHTYEEIVALADSLVAEFPDICMKVMYGESIEGRELAALKISDNVIDDENEAEILFDGGIHGDEIGGPENCIRFARILSLLMGATLTSHI